MSHKELFSEPVVGVPLLEPESAPLPGDRLLGYRLVTAPRGVFTTPKPKKLSFGGWVSVGVLVFVFWPLAWAPCVFSACYSDTYQVPVYGR